MSEIKTLEQLFIRDYEKLQNEVEKLKEKNAELQNICDKQQNIISEQQNTISDKNCIINQLLKFSGIETDDVSVRCTGETHIWFGSQWITRTEENALVFDTLLDYVNRLKVIEESRKEQEGKEEHE